MKATSAVWDKQRPIVPAIPFLFKSIIRTSLIFWFLIKHCCVTTTDIVIYIVRPKPKSGAPRLSFIYVLFSHIFISNLLTIRPVRPAHYYK